VRLKKEKKSGWGGGLKSGIALGEKAELASNEQPTVVWKQSKKTTKYENDKNEREEYRNWRAMGGKAKAWKRRKTQQNLQTSSELFHKSVWARKPAPSRSSRKKRHNISAGERWLLEKYSQK